LWTDTKYAWFSQTNTNLTHEAGKKLPNELDIYDMSGNVLEFCWDWFANLPSGNLKDYRGPDSPGSLRLVHGGGYNSEMYYLFLWERRTADKNITNPKPYDRKDNTGMRVVCYD
jgi:formylglycine-generating enzyme required for sulfatase activity